MREAVNSLEKNGFRVEAVSSFCRSAAEKCLPGTPDFWDQAVVGSWEASPEELLTLCQHLETAAGRPKVHRSDESRILDCDLICFGNELRNTPFLTLPHPRARERLFVLGPLAEIAPSLRFPDGESIEAAYRRLCALKGVRP